MINFKLLMKKIKEQGLGLAQFLEKTGLSEDYLSLGDIKVGEVEMIRKLLKLSGKEASDIFFA